MTHAQNLVLHNYFRSSAAYRVRIAVNLKGLDYQYLSVHLTRDGGMQFIDVRDLAALICALVIDGGAGRFLLPGVYSRWIRSMRSGANIRYSQRSGTYSPNGTRR